MHTAWTRLRRLASHAATLARMAPVSAVFASGLHRGVCPICERRTVFVKAGEWLRDQYYCTRCLSIPRFRAIIRVLEQRFPAWRDLAVHESSPGGAASAKLARECRRYVATHYSQDVAPGLLTAGYRCEDLERQTFPDGAFDLVITQDVFEHVLDPARAFAEVARTLRPGGAHVFTLPWYHWRPTVVRARRENGQVIHDSAPAYHEDPRDRRGSLVVTEWGLDLLDFIERTSGLQTTVENLFDAGQGISGEFRDVFISRKPDVP